MAHSTDKASALQQGVIIFVYLAVLTALEFGVAAFVPNLILLAAIALFKAGLVVYYYMHIYKLGQDDSHLDREGYDYRANTNRLGLWLFLISDAFVFAALLITRFNLWGMTRPHLNQTLGLAVTSVLLLSSFFMNRAETCMAHGDRKAFLRNTLLTIALGTLFLVGVVGLEWRLAHEEGVIINQNKFGAVFYMMTGMHAFHVLTGVLFLLLVFRNALRGVFSAERHWGVEAAAVYWHFVDVVWIFFYPALYLIGTLA